MSIQKFRTILLLLLSLIIIASCSSKKVSSHQKHSTSKDSIFYKEKFVIYPSINDTIYIDKPCDSLGNFKTFRETFITSQGKITIEGKNNALKAKIELKETSTSEKSFSKISENTSFEKSESTNRIITQNWKILIALLLSISFNILLLIKRFR